MPVEDFLALPRLFSSFSSNSRKREKTRGKRENPFRIKKKIAKPLFCRYSAPAFLSSTISNGQVSEWSNEHAWKVCVPQTGTEGSNPSLSAINFPPQYVVFQYIAVFVCRGMGKIGLFRWRSNQIRFFNSFEKM